MSSNENHQLKMRGLQVPCVMLVFPYEKSFGHVLSNASQDAFAVAALVYSCHCVRPESSDARYRYVMYAGERSDHNKSGGRDRACRRHDPELYGGCSDSAWSRHSQVKHPGFSEYKYHEQDSERRRTFRSSIAHRRAFPVAPSMPTPITFRSP